MIPEEITNLDCELQIAQAFHQCFKCIIINIYLPSYNKFGSKKRKTLKNWIIHFISQNSHEKIIICGDFNHSSPLLPELINHNTTN